ncbi:MAG TPA: hypothetical protein VN088_11760, partial [Nocardioides sp.]|nr:hypothetical protein [Nocardioides sp.]
SVAARTTRVTGGKSRMHHRRPKAVAAPVVGLLLAASLSACGFHYPTDRVNTISAGENNRTTPVAALGIRILASGPGEGRLIGALSNGSTTSTATITKVEVAGGGTTVAPFKPIRLQDSAAYNLSAHADNPVTLSGDFEPGQVLMGVQITFTLGGQPETISLNVPVVKNCHQYTAVPTPTPTTSATTKSDAPSATLTALGTDLYNCTDPSPSEAPAE